MTVRAILIFKGHLINEVFDVKVQKHARIAALILSIFAAVLDQLSSMGEVQKHHFVMGLLYKNPLEER